MEISSEEILETIKMVEVQNLDIRVVTMSINLLDCSHPDVKVLKNKIKQKIVKYSKNLVKVCQQSTVFPLLMNALRLRQFL